MPAGASPASLGGQLRAFPGRAVPPGKGWVCFLMEIRKIALFFPVSHLFLLPGITPHCPADHSEPPQHREIPAPFSPLASFGKGMGE